MLLSWQFVLGSGISSRSIAWFSAGHFSHVDAVMPGGYLLGARSDRVGHRPPGVQVRPPAYETWKERVVMSLEVQETKARAFFAFLNGQIGKPYDKTAIFGFAAGRDWREEDSWFCSELQTAAIEAANITPALYAPAAKITPAGLAIVLSAIGASVDKS
jgi:hypothetical protein